MPVTKVIQLGPSVQYAVLGRAVLETFGTQLQVMLVQVDEKGEQVRGGVEMSDTFTGQDFTDLVGVLAPTFLPAVLAKMTARGTLKPGATVVDVK